MGIGMAPENTGQIRVRTITITAPQHGHRRDGRFLISADV